MLILIARIEGFDFSLEEASRDLGENAWGTFYRVSLPLYLPGIVAALLLSFIISFDEFVLAFFLTGSDATLPMYMWAHMYIGNVASLPVKKNARTNSSNEIIKLNKSAATIPGKYNGSDTR